MLTTDTIHIFRHIWAEFHLEIHLTSPFSKDFSFFYFFFQSLSISHFITTMTGVDSRESPVRPFVYFCVVVAALGAMNNGFNTVSFHSSFYLRCTIAVIKSNHCILVFSQYPW
jgi:hypothetical protein